MASNNEAKITLHWLNFSRAQATLFLLEELKVPYEIERYHRQPNFMAPPELAKVHPLGKSPVVTITPAGGETPVVLAETAFIVQYLCEHFGQHSQLIPKRWKDGKEGQVCGETDAWMRYQYLMYFAEGSFMSTLMLVYMFSGLKGPRVPFLIRPITKMIANQTISGFILPNIKKQLAMLEGFLDTPVGDDGGEYLCGSFSAADAVMAYACQVGKEAFFDNVGSFDKGSFKDTYPKLNAYIERVAERPGWKSSVDKIVQLEGKCGLVPS